LSKVLIYVYNIGIQGFINENGKIFVYVKIKIMKFLSKIAFFCCLFLLISGIGFLGLKLPLQISNFLLLFGLTFFIQNLVPPFALNPLVYILRYYKSRDFWKEYIAPSTTPEEIGKINYKDFEYLDKLVSLSRNILLIIATLSAIIITFSSNNLRDWFFKREVKVMGFIDTNCEDEEWTMDPNLTNAFIIVHYRTTIQEPFKGNESGDKMKELLIIENGQYEKYLSVPKPVKYLKLELVMKHPYSICNDKNNKSDGFVHSIDENLVYREFSISLQDKANNNEDSKEKPM